MKTVEKQALQGLSIDELKAKEMELRQELFSLRLYSTTKPARDNQGAKKIRKDIARLLTVMQQKRAEL
jgi:large subunit ribosomal protein L29